MTCQPLWIILYQLIEKERKEKAELTEERKREIEEYEGNKSTASTAACSAIALTSIKCHNSVKNEIKRKVHLSFPK